MWIAVLAIIAYLGALLSIMPTLLKVEQNPAEAQPQTKLVLGLGASAVLLHLVSLSQHLFLGEGQNLTIPNIVSLMSVMMSLGATLAITRWKTVWFPLPIVYALGLISVTLANFVEGSFIRQLAEKPSLLFHLGIALFSYALFFIALLYAFQLKWLDGKLKSKKLMFCPMLPPLMTVERHFFTLTLSAQAMLTLALMTGMISLHNFFAPEQVHKALFSFLAWIVYAIQLLGQWKLHWRGNRVLIYSISGIILLSIGYFGSRVG